ncbi:MAG: hypothetical protein AMS27_17955 [Bacteroides sp. SM23_62_1]|nr:MAG: hypothetical protein AMS27_17955 [Bacteroides sp. SM23_62_1]
MCRAYCNAGMSNLTHNTVTTIVLDTETYDVGSNFNTGTYTFTTPVAGYYLICASIGYSNVVSSARYDTMVYIDGALLVCGIQQLDATGPANIELAPFVSDIFYIASGKTIQLKGIVRHASADTVDVAGSSNKTFMTIMLLA